GTGNRILLPREDSGPDRRPRAGFEVESGRREIRTRRWGDDGDQEDARQEYLPIVPDPHISLSLNTAPWSRPADAACRPPGSSEIDAAGGNAGDEEGRERREAQGEERADRHGHRQEEGPGHLEEGHPFPLGAGPERFDERHQSGRQEQNEKQDRAADV